MNTAVKWIKRIGLVFLVLSVLGIGWLFTRPGMADVGIPYAPTASVKSTAVTVKWFGVATLLIDDGETQIMTDGFFSRPSLLDVALKRPIGPDVEKIASVLEAHDINRLAAIIPVHSHYDHAMDSGEVAKKTGAMLLGSKSTAFVGRSSLVPEEQIHIIETGKAYTFGKFKVTFYESKHAPLSSNSGIDGKVQEVFELPTPYTTWQLGAAYSILVEHPNGSLLVQGSAGYLPGAFEKLDVDAVFLGTGGLRNQTREYRESYIYETVTLTNPDVVYTIHHDNMFGTLGNVEQSSLLPEFDSMAAFELSQLILPARFEQMRFAQPIEIPLKTNSSN
ncbi:MAG: L-ascorbate metabolism protein UlaG (beta-lactamase superfamily) [Oceanicoccus sp.]|jgi:L-ascorbate metabolism protein UlaG (beta-lactamase superfamily)